jgi:hypothetical protein
VREAARIPGMLLDPIRAGAAPPAELVVREVRSEEDLVRYQETAFAGFGFPATSGQLFLTAQLLDMPNVKLYLGLVGDRPACTSALCASGPVAGIYWVATLPELRDFPVELLPMHRNVSEAGKELYFDDRFRVQLSGRTDGGQ